MALTGIPLRDPGTTPARFEPCGMELCPAGRFHFQMRR